jgi:hypothetical protein
MAKKSLGTPPPVFDTNHNLVHPEVAPITDQRTLRRTGRDAQLNIPVSETFRDEFRTIALRYRLTAWQLLAASLRAYQGLPEEAKTAIITEVVTADPAARYKTR